MSVRFDVLHNTASDYVKAVGAALAAALPALVAVTSDNHLTLNEGVGVFWVFVAAGLAGLGLYDSSAVPEIPPITKLAEKPIPPLATLYDPETGKITLINEDTKEPIISPEGPTA